MDKKKKAIQDSPEEAEVKDSKTTSSTRVTQVVEVIEIEKTEDGDSDNQKQIPEDEEVTEKSHDGEDEEAKDEKEDVKDDEKTQTEDTDGYEEEEDEAPKHSEKETQKAVVEELFSKPASGDVMEISLGRKKTHKTLMLWAIVVIVAAVVVGAGLLLFTTKKSGSPTPVSDEKTNSTPAVVSPTQKPMVLSRSELSVQVLNGGGKAGAATKMKTLLTEKGYTVAEVGNTDEYTYDLTKIVVKPGKEGAIELLKSDLKDEYTLDTTTATLSSSSTYDVQVIVGKE